MKSLNDVIENYKSETLTGRDLQRLSQFIREQDLQTIGLRLTDNSKERKILEWNEENVLKKLKTDLEFSFEKALNCRGISASEMYEVIKMWMYVLEDELYHDDDYAQYGLPLFKKVAVKYNFDNPIGDDYGNEDTYQEQLIDYGDALYIETFISYSDEKDLHSQIDNTIESKYDNNYVNYAFKITPTQLTVSPNGDDFAYYATLVVYT